MRSWSELCVELLELIVNQLSTIEDIVRFKAVCQLWRSAPIKKRQLSPCLMLADEKYNYSFYSPSTQKVYHLNLPEVCRKSKWWSSGGWLITSGFDREICFVNPFSHEEIRFPPLPCIPMEPEEFRPELSAAQTIFQLYIWKVIISSSPTTTTLDDDDEEKCVVMVMTSIPNVLTFLRMGDKVWTVIRIRKSINDVIYFNGEFYAITVFGELLLVDISSLQPKIIEFAQGIGLPSLNVSCYYLVESGGELFCLARRVQIAILDAIQHLCKYQYHKTVGFCVSKFNFDNRGWTCVKSLDNCAMFVGFNTSFSIFPSNKFGCRPNCIYFTDAHNLISTRKNDIGVFRVDTQGIRDFFDGPGIFYCNCVAHWIQPSL